MNRPAAVLAAHVVAAVLLAGCRSNDAGTAPLESSDAPALARGGAGASHLTAEMVNVAGDVIGTARFTEDATGVVHLTVHVKGVSPGLHGMHVHTTGVCTVGTTPTFTSAGAHYNPAARQHGHLNPAGFHAGDLPNLEVNAAGVGNLSASVQYFSLAALRAGDGSALVLHASPDDYLTDPTGNSGARIACGVLND